MGKVNIDVNLLKLGKGFKKHVLWGHLFIETDKYVFIAIQRYGLAAQLFGKFKMRIVLEK